MGKRRIRPLKVCRSRVPKQTAGVGVEAIERIIEARVEPLQTQIKVLQSNAITTMVILGDIRNSVMLALSSDGSAKRRLEELLEHMDAATSNIQEFIGVPQRILDQNYVEHHTMEEAEIENTLREALGSIVRSSPSIPSSEGDDIVENVSEGYDEEEYLDEEDAMDFATEDQADAYRNTQRRGRPRRRRR